MEWGTKGHPTTPHHTHGTHGGRYVVGGGGGKPQRADAAGRASIRAGSGRCVQLCHGSLRTEQDILHLMEAAAAAADFSKRLQVFQREFELLIGLAQATITFPAPAHALQGGSEKTCNYQAWQRHPTVGESLLVLSRSISAMASPTVGCLCQAW